MSLKLVPILMLILVNHATADIGVIDFDPIHLENMERIIYEETPEPTRSLLVKNDTEWSMAIYALAGVKVDVIAMPIQGWTYSPAVADAIAYAVRSGITVYGAGSNDAWYANDFGERLKRGSGGKLQRYPGAVYVERSFFRSASVKCVMAAARWAE